MRKQFTTRRQQLKGQYEKLPKGQRDIENLKEQYNSVRKQYIKQVSEVRKQLDKSVISYFQKFGGNVQEGVDVNLNPKGYSSNGFEGILMDGSKLQDRGKILTVFAHSNENKIHDQRQSKKGTILDGSELTDVLKQNQNYAGSVGILIYGCKAGKFADGLAAEVAKRTGLPTLAPNKSIWVGKNRDLPFIAGSRPHPKHPLQRKIMDPNDRGDWKGAGPSK